MKKIVLFVAVLSAFSFASCKKDRTCTCTSSAGVTTSNDPNYVYVAPTTNYTSTTVTTVAKVKKGDAKKACITSVSNHVSTYGNYTYTTPVTETCDLK